MHDSHSRSALGPIALVGERLVGTAAFDSRSAADTNGLTLETAIRHDPRKANAAGTETTGASHRGIDRRSATASDAPKRPSLPPSLCSPRSGSGRRAEGFLAEVLLRRANHSGFCRLEVDVDERPEPDQR